LIGGNLWQKVEVINQRFSLEHQRRLVKGVHLAHYSVQLLAMDIKRNIEDKENKINECLNRTKHSFFMFSEKELYILQWIRKVSEVRPELNGFSICPFAANAKFKIIECSAEDICPLDDYQVIIYIVEDHFDLDTVNFWVNYYNSKHKDWKFFEDCGCYDTFINGIQTNNGKYNLILGQPTKKLRKFRESLAKTSYYDLWDREYLKEILEDDYDIIKERDSNPVKSSDLTNQELKNDQTS